MIADLFLQPEITSTAAWQRLSELAGKVQITPISALFEHDPKRNQKFSILWESLFFDYSKNQITTEIMESLTHLARSRQLPLAIQGLFQGEIFNLLSV